MRKLKLAAILLIAFILNACSRDNTSCTHGFIIEPINFRVIDKTTNQDLFFSDNPQYTVNDLMLSYKGTKMMVQVKAKNDGQKYLSFYVQNLDLGTDSVMMKIGNSLAEPIIYNVALSNHPCPAPVFTQIIYKGITETNIKGQILIFKR